MAKENKIRIAFAQINPHVGDFSGNIKKIIEYIRYARESGAEMVVFPQLSVCGYPPGGLAAKPGFVEKSEAAISEIATHTSGIAALVGFLRVGERVYDSVALLSDGAIIGQTDRCHLECSVTSKKHNTSGTAPNFSYYRLRDMVFGVGVGEDVLARGTLGAGAASGFAADLLINIASSPFCVNSSNTRNISLGQLAHAYGCSLAHINAVGGQDEYVFDGQSMLLDATGEIVFRCKAFEEQLAILDFSLPSHSSAKLTDAKNAPQIIELSSSAARPIADLPAASHSSDEPAEVEAVYNALVLATRDFLHKNGFKSAALGLSGGIDSAIVACIVVDAIGADNVRVLIMPSQYSSHETQSDAQILAENLGMRYDYIPISDILALYTHSLETIFDGTSPDVTEENLQARIRGNLLMALSNKTGAMVLTTSNKSEVACGYSTLYGDMAGGFAVLKDVSKTLVYKLVEYRNHNGYPIPESTIVRPPSAELRPNQTDQDSLPPYDILDPILELYVEQHKTPKQIIEQGYDEAIVYRVVGLVDSSEFKRRQSAPGIKITSRAFGVDYILPVTNAYKES